jgi:hypothetical protein
MKKQRLRAPCDGSQEAYRTSVQFISRPQSPSM